MLRNYVKEGITELDVRKLNSIRTAKYGSVTNAKKELGNLDVVRDTFIDFQQYLYSEQPTTT